MAEIIKMPKLSDTMTEGVVAKWNKKVGEKVKNGEILAEIETDKATMEFESFVDGVLLHIGVETGKAVPIDALIAIIGNEGENISALIASTKSNDVSEINQDLPAAQITHSQSVPPAAKKPEIPATIQIIRMPKLSDTMTEGVVSKWMKKKGDKVKNGEILAAIDTDKATMEFESFFDGVLMHLGVEAGKSAQIDSLLAIIGNGNEDISAIIAYELAHPVSALENASAAQPATKQEPVLSEITTATSGNGTSKILSADAKPNSSSRLKASPLAKKLAKEKNLDLYAIQGSGDGGRIIRKDIVSFTPQFANLTLAKEGFTDAPVSQMRKAIAKRLVESKNSAPHFYLTIELDMDHAIAAREALNLTSETKISFNDFVIKACAHALRKHPRVNGSWMTDKIRYFSHIHIGMAVAIEDGLIVPVIRFADTKSVPQISIEAKVLGKKAKEKKLIPSDWEGNTFTVSNLGMFGIEEFTSIINSPEACILAVGAIRKVPVVKNGMVVPGNTMKVTLSCDHRVVDGATGSAFLQTLKTFIENPVTLFL